MDDIEKLVRQLVDDTVVSDLKWADVWNDGDTSYIAYQTTVNGITVKLIRSVDWKCFTKYKLLGGGSELAEGSWLKPLWDALTHRIEIEEIARRKEQKVKNESYKQEVLRTLLEKHE